MPSSRIPFLAIRAGDALLPVDLLQRLIKNDHEPGGLAGQKQKGVQTHMEPNFPPDVLGIYVYLPRA